MQTKSKRFRFFSRFFGFFVFFLFFKYVNILKFLIKCQLVTKEKKSRSICFFLTLRKALHEEDEEGKQTNSVYFFVCRLFVVLVNNIICQLNNKFLFKIWKQQRKNPILFFSALSFCLSVLCCGSCERDD